MRWKNFIPFIIILAAGTIIYLFFLNIIIEKSIEGLGSKIVGAKVEVRKVHFNLFKLSTRISGLKAANPKDEWRNMFEAEDIRFAISPWPLFQRKFVIDEMALVGATWNTKRTASGKLPAKKKKKEEPSETGEAKPSMPNIANALAKKVDIAQFLDINKLGAVSRINEMKTDIDTKIARWQQEFQANDLKAQADGIGKIVSEIKIGQGMSVDDAKNALTKLNDIKSGLDKIRADIDTKKTSFDADVKTISGYTGEIDNIRKLDLKKLLGEITGGIDVKSIAKSLMGPVWINRVNNTLYWIDRGRKYMPKNIKIKPPKRSKGIWVSFPNKHHLPGFLIRKILVTGQAPNGMEFSGTILGINSSPPIYGQPTIVDLKAWFPNVDTGKTFAQVKIVLDHTTKDAQDDFTVLARAIPIADFNLGQSDFLPTVLNIGSGDITMGLTLKEKTLDSKIDLAFNNVGFSSSSGAPSSNEFSKIISEILSKIGRVNINGKLAGPMDNLNFEMSSNLDSLLSQRFNEVVGRRLKEEEMKLRAEVDRIVNQGKQELQAKIDEYKKQVQAKLDEYKSVVEGQIQLAQAKIDEVKKQVQSQIGQEKKKVEDELKKKGDELKKEAEKKLKGLFGR